MITLEQFEKDAPGYVAAGAEWLDANEPGWERRINLASLELMDSCRCVLGQVTREQDYLSAVTRIWLGGIPNISAREWTATHGFNIPQYQTAGLVSEYFAILDELWIALVKERFDTGCLSG